MDSLFGLSTQNRNFWRIPKDAINNDSSLDPNSTLSMTTGWNCNQVSIKVFTILDDDAIEEWKVV